MVRIFIRLKPIFSWLKNHIILSFFPLSLLGRHPETHVFAEHQSGLGFQSWNGTE